MKCLTLAVLALLAPAVPEDEPRLERRDMAQVFVRLDADLATMTPEDPAWKQVNLEFDAIASMFFTGRLRAASDAMASLRARQHDLDDEQRVAFRVAAALRPVLRDPSARDSDLELFGTWPVRAAAGRTVGLAVRVERPGREPLELPCEVLVDELTGRAGRALVELPELSEEEGEARLTVLDPSGQPHARLYWTPADESHEARRARLLAAVEAVEAPELAGAVTEFRERCELLVDGPQGARTLDVAHSPRVFWDQLDGELAELVAGRDPYRHERVAGALWWRRIPNSLREVFTLQRIAPTDGPEDLRPLVIALHGAGGDEAYFVAAGGGRLVDAAAQHGFHLVMPYTYQVLYDWEAFDAVLRDALERYPVDPERVYVMGHSLGGVTTSGLVKVRGDAIAAASCIAGLRPLRGETPVLVQAAPQDRIFSIDQVRRDVRRSERRGAEVTLEVVPGAGHVLVVGPAIDRALAWFGLTGEESAPAESDER